MKKKIIAVVGMCGAGKTVVTNYLMKKFDAPKVYFGDATFDRMKADGLELNYENEGITREKIRAELGMGAYATLAIPKIDKLLTNNLTVIAESLYSWDEYKIMKDHYQDQFEVLAVFASPKKRFARLNNRDNERPIKDIETFIKRDYTELENLAKGAPIARADYTVINDGSMSNLDKHLEEIINNII